MKPAKPTLPPSSRLNTAAVLAQSGQMIFAIAVAMAIHHGLYDYPGTPRQIVAAAIVGGSLMVAAAALADRLAGLGREILRAASVGGLGIAVVELWYYFVRSPHTLQRNEKITLFVTLAGFLVVSLFDRFFKQRRH